MEVRVVEHRSPEWEAEVQLRREVLRWPLGLEFSQEELEEESRDYHIAAFDEGQLLGCLVLTPVNCSVVKMRQVAVRPNLQGKGVGAEMVHFSEQHAASLGYTLMTLNARDTAVPFYLKLGYEVVGDPFEEVTIPHLKMEKTL